MSRERHREKEGQGSRVYPDSELGKGEHGDTRYTEK